LQKPEESKYIFYTKNIFEPKKYLRNSDSMEISLQDIEFAKHEIKNMISSVRAQTLQSDHRPYHSLTRLIINHWPLGNKLGVEIAELEEEYVRLLS